MSELTRKCKKCNRSVPARDVRLQMDGTFMCFACAGYNPQPGTTSRSTNTPKEVPKEPRSRDRVRYQCMKCKYVFFLKDGQPQRCPYCAGSNVEEKTDEAQRLIDMHVNFRDND